MSIRRRRKTEQFTQINNSVLLNPHLTLKAKGLLAVMMSRPEQWVFYMDWLEKQSRDGREAHQTAMRELEKGKYVVRLRVQRPNGTFKGWEYLVDDAPILDIEPGTIVVQEDENPLPPTDGKPGRRSQLTDKRENRQSGKPTDGKPAANKKEFNKTDSDKKGGGENSLEGDTHEGDELSASAIRPSSAEHSSSKNEKQHPTPEGLRNSAIFGTSLTSLIVVPQVEASQPDGTADAVGQDLLVDLQDSTEPLVGMNEQATSLEKVPGRAAAGAGLAKELSGAGNGAGRVGVDSIQPLDAQELAARPVEPVDGPAYLALRSLLGKKNLPELVKELTRTGGLSRDPWLKLTEGEIGLVRVLAQEEAKLTGANTLTLAVRGLDRLIGAVRVEKSASAKLAAAQVDPQLLTGQRCRVDAPDGTWALGVVQEVHEVQYRILLDDQGVRKIDRTSVAELRILRASDAPAPTVAATPAPEGPALFAPVGTSWRRVAGKGGQLGEVVTVQGVLGTKRKLSNGGELAFYTIQKDFEQVLA